MRTCNVYTVDTWHANRFPCAPTAIGHWHRQRSCTWCKLPPGGRGLAPPRMAWLGIRIKPLWRAALFLGSVVQGMQPKPVAPMVYVCVWLPQWASPVGHGAPPFGCTPKLVMRLGNAWGSGWHTFGKGAGLLLVAVVLRVGQRGWLCCRQSTFASLVGRGT